MADDMKEIAKLQFDISKAEGQLETLNKAFEKFNKTNKTMLNDYAKTQNKIAVLNLSKNNKIEIQDNKALNNIKVINAKKELEEQKTLNKITVMHEKAASSQRTIWAKVSNLANTYLLTRGLQELKQAAVELVQEMTDVEYKMIEIDRVLNEDSLNIDNYRDKLIQLAYNYGNSFDNVSDVTSRLAKAGFDSTETLALTEKTLLALNTAELDATEATEDMIAVMSQWNLMTGNATKEAEDYARIIDEINIVADNFPIKSQDLMEALKKTSSAFNVAGASIEETIATIVAAEKASQRGGKAIGTAMNNIVQKLRDTGSLATMEAMGLDIYTDAAKTEFKSVMDILGELSGKMQQLKREGKENTKEMQELLSVFTLFRRNVGTSLLGEMGEGGTYDEVLKLLGESGEGALGYSLEENKKHMDSAEAAMAQFNAQLLILKTKIWDAGLRDVFIGILTLGGELIEVISDLVEIFGSGETTISVFVAALESITGVLEKVRDAFKAVQESTQFIRDINDKLEEGGFVAKTFGAYLSTMKEMFQGLNPAMGTTLDVLDGLINKEEEVSEATEELSEKLDEGIIDENELDNLGEGFSSINSILSNSIDTLNQYAEQYSMLDTAVNEFNSTGEITAETLKKLVDNNLLQYLDLSSDKAYINADAFNQLAIQTQNQAAEALIAAANNDMLAVAEGRLSDVSAIGQGALQGIGSQITDVGNRSSAAAIQVADFAQQIANIAGGLNVTGEIQKQVNAIGTAYTNTYKSLVGATKRATSGISKASSGAAKSAGGAAKQATKTFEEQSQERVKTFKEEINKLISLEENWVKKYKQLNLLSTSDLMFIQQQRINKYGEILNQINNLQGISEKDRASLVQEYSKQRQEAELEYFDLLKQKLDDQIKQLKEANEERIQGIKDAADAQIDALNKVEDENDRIKQKEEYERKRNELIYGNQGIEYWRQRTGREAQLALQEAEEKLRDLDEDWEEKKKDWTLEDQIKQIEDARDAQIKAIEDAQERQIEGWQAAYNEQVRLYAETGQIIYDNSVINAGYLYNAYMDNFVNPLQSQLQNVIASLNTASATASEVAGKMGSGGGGGGSAATVANNIANVQQGPQPVSATGMPTWATIQQRAATAAASSTAKKILSNAKKYLGKFHGGGEVGSSTEAIAILRPKEVVLQPEWAATIKKLERSVSNGIGISGGTNIDVQGNLINMDGVKINDRKDADYLTERIEKVFRDKFNIRK